MPNLPGGKASGLLIVLLAACSTLLQGSDAASVGNANVVSTLLKQTTQLSKMWQAFQACGLDKDGTIDGSSQRIEATAFFPTDDAINKFLVAQKITWAKFLSNPTTVRAFILNHIVSGYQIKNFGWLYDGQQLPTLLTRVNGRSKLTVIKQGKVLKLKADMSTCNVGGNYVQARDFRIIFVDNVLAPDLLSKPVPLPGLTFKSVADAICTLPGLETTCSTLKTDPASFTYFSDPNLVATVFVPNNKALQYPILDLKTTPAAFISDAAYLNKLWQFQTVPGVVTPSSVFKDNQKLTARNGKQLTIKLFNEHIAVAGPLSKGKFIIHLPPRLQSMTNVLKGQLDIKCGKAVIHVIDHWLLL